MANRIERSTNLQEYAREVHRLLVERGCPISYDKMVEVYPLNIEYFSTYAEHSVAAYYIEGEEAHAFSLQVYTEAVRWLGAEDAGSLDDFRENLAAELRFAQAEGMTPEQTVKGFLL